MKMNTIIPDFWKILSFPQSSMVSKRISKKMFLENDKINTDFKSLLNNIDCVYWQYVMRRKNTNLLAVKNSQEDFSELSVIEIRLKEKNRYKTIAENIHKIIPYHILLIFIFEENISLSIATKRLNFSNKNEIVILDTYTTNLFDYKKERIDFVKSLNWNNYYPNNLKDLYLNWLDRLVSCQKEEISGVYEIENHEKAYKEIKEYGIVQNKIAELRNLIKSADFNEQINLNIQIKKLEKELADIISKF